MNNEQKILTILESMQADITGLKQGQVDTNSRLDVLQADMNKRFDEIQEDIDILKEDSAITRNATNILLAWAEKAERTSVNMGLYSDDN
jgi:hypothetical protein